MRFSTYIWSNLWRRRSRSLLTLAGVGIGVASGVSMFALARGFKGDLIRKYAARNTQMVVTGVSEKKPLPSLLDQGIGDELAKMPGVLGVAGALWDLQNIKGSPAFGVMGWQAGSFLWDHLVPVPGEGPFPKTGDETLYLGQIASGYLHKGKGDAIEFETDQSVTRTFHVAGVFESVALAENAAVVMRLDLLQSLIGCAGKVNYFNLHLDPQLTPQQFETLRKNIRARFPRLNVMGVAEIAQNSAGIRAANAMITATTAIALLVGVLGVTNTLLMNVFERAREIGLLMAVGWKPIRIAVMVLMESLLLCICGATAGIIAAVAGVKTMEQMDFLRGKFTAEFGVDQIVLTFLIAGAMGLLGGIYPAFLASRCQPRQALHHE